MNPHALAAEINNAREWFDRSTCCLSEENSAFTPAEGVMTAAQQVAHVAQTVDWFIEGGFRPEGFDTDFEAAAKRIFAVESLSAAREWLGRAFEGAAAKVGACSAEELAEPLPPGMVMGGLPRATIVGGIVDHTAHHRGALTVYSRLCGLEPAMPYMEM